MANMRTSSALNPAAAETIPSSVAGRRCKSFKKVEKEGWKLLGLLMLYLVVSAEAQTFQYSRGWTNGKRNGMNLGPLGVYGGASSVLGPYDLESNGILGSNPLEVIIPPGHLRHRGEYGQYLVKRSVTLGDTRKPVWFGTVVADVGPVASSSPKPRTVAADF